MSRHIRPIRIEGNIAYVLLTQGYEAVIDAADLYIVDGYNWRALIRPRVVYATRTDGGKAKKRTILMHRAILRQPKGFHVDHKDGNGLNNRRENIRTATKSQNSCNQRLSNGNTSGFKGVSFFKQTSRWQARIMVNGKSKHLGLFDSADLAHQAYREASAKYHGTFGRVE